MAKEERHCMNCEHSIFCGSWGEYKCLIKIRRIYEPEKEAFGCGDFKQVRRNVNDKKETKCRCKRCIEQEGEGQD